MNRTIEQWQKVAETRFHGRVLDQAIEDLKELARQLETERAAWSKKRTEVLRNHAAELVRRKDAGAQRDELLAAIDELLDGADAIGWGATKARAVIQKVRGGEC